jgi:hypothetical protein
LKISPDARSAALSGAFVAMVDDVSALYWNPACMSKMDSNKYHFQAGHTAYFADMGMHFLGFTYSRDRLHHWGLSLVSLSSGDMIETTEFQPFGTGRSFSVTDLMIGISFAKVLSDNFSFGLSGKYVSENIADVITYNGMFDFGFIYSVGVRQSTRFAVSISNFGFNVRPGGRLTLNTLNGEKEITDFEKIAVPTIFRLGIVSPLYINKHHSLSAAAQLNHPTDNNETLALGFEYSLKKLLFLRSGYEFGTDQSAIPTFGFGLQMQRYFGYLGFHYAFHHLNPLGTVHRLSVAIGLK